MRFIFQFSILEVGLGLAELRKKPDRPISSTERRAGPTLSAKEKRVNENIAIAIISKERKFLVNCSEQIPQKLVRREFGPPEI